MTFLATFFAGIGFLAFLGACAFGMALLIYKIGGDEDGSNR